MEWSPAAVNVRSMVDGCDDGTMPCFNDAIDDAEVTPAGGVQPCQFKV
jgi:hypothetical protein